MAKMVLCPRCCGFPEFDEEGKLYSCYFCCDSGMVPEAVAAAEARDAAWARHVSAERAIKRRIELGVPAGWGYYIDEYEGVVMIPPRKLVAPKVWGADAVSEMDDDIPF